MGLKWIYFYTVPRHLNVNQALFYGAALYTVPRHLRAGNKDKRDIQLRCLSYYRAAYISFAVLLYVTGTVTGAIAPLYSTEGAHRLA